MKKLGDKGLKKADKINYSPKKEASNVVSAQKNTTFKSIAKPGKK